MLLSELVQQIFREAWGGVLHTQNFWLRRDGEWKKCGSHERCAKELSGLTDEEEAYEWMFARDWAKIIVENNEIFVTMTKWKDNGYQLTKLQKDAILLKAKHDYPFPLEINALPSSLMNL